MKRFITLFIGLTFCMVYFILQSKNTYMEDKPVKVLVTNKFEKQGTHKSSGMLYLIVKDDRGRNFDISVEPVTYVNTKIGERVTFTLREFDIRQTKRDNIIYFFLPAILMSCSIVITIAGIISVFSKHKTK